MREQTKLVFETKEHALEYLWSIDSLCTNLAGKVFWYRGVYHLSHGEYDQPEYVVRRYKDGWGIHVTHFYYRGTYGAPKSGRLVWSIWEEE